MSKKQYNEHYYSCIELYIWSMGIYLWYISLNKSTSKILTILFNVLETLSHLKRQTTPFRKGCRTIDIFTPLASYGSNFLKALALKKSKKIAKHWKNIAGTSRDDHSYLQMIFPTCQNNFLTCLINFPNFPNTLFRCVSISCTDDRVSLTE